MGHRKAIWYKGLPSRLPPSFLPGFSVHCVTPGTPIISSSLSQDLHPRPNLVPICQSIWGQCVCMCACLLSHSVMSDSFVSPHDRMDCSPPGSSSMGFSRQEYWSGLPCSSPRDPPDPGIKPESLASPAWAGGFFSTRATWEALSLQQSRGNRGPLCALPPRDLESLHKYPNN